MSNSILRLVRRSIKASRLGFPFYGTSRTLLPKAVTLAGRRVALTTPGDGGYLCDIINLWLDDEYGLSKLNTAGTIVDVGANIGLFSLWAAHNFPNAEIHAYEPNPRVLSSLRANVTGFPVKIFPFGVGRERGRAEMRDDSASRLAMTRNSSEGEIEIHSLAEVVKRCGGVIDILKLDCEGAEWALFDDVESFQHVSEIRMEYHLINGNTLDDFKKSVRKLGFSLIRLVPNQGFGVAWLKRIGSQIPQE